MVHFYQLFLNTDGVIHKFVPKSKMYSLAGSTVEGPGPGTRLPIQKTQGCNSHVITQQGCNKVVTRLSQPCAQPNKVVTTLCIT